MPRDIPAKEPHKEVGGCQLIVCAQREGEVTEQASVGASESEHRPKTTPPRADIVDGGIYNRCLKDAAADDGVLISCCKNSIKNLRRFSHRV